MTTTTVPTLPESQPAYLRRDLAAAYVQRTYGYPCSRQWLAKLAVIGGGPRFYLAGRFPLYAPADLDSWAKGRIAGPVQSTSEARSAA